MRTIAVQRGLDTIKNKLENLGYRVFYHDEISTPIDAFIYYSEPENLSLVTINNILSNNLYLINHNENINNPILINGYQKSIEEIQQIIDYRLYSPLF